MVHVCPFHLLARGSDSGEWVNLIILLALVLGSAVLGLVKSFVQARQKAGQKGPARLAPRDRPTSNWRERLQQRLEQMQYQEPERRAPVFDPERSDRREAPEAGQSETASAPSARAPVRQSYSGEQERVAGDAVAAALIAGKAKLHRPEPMRELAGPQPKPPAGLTSAVAAGEVVIDLGDPEALTRAIVQYEVLGKPLGLRGLPSEHVTDRIY